MNHELHPLCTLFPRMAGKEFDALCADIKANGLREPITLHNGMILDGGNRYRACVDAGIEPRFAEFDGDNIVQFVLSMNLHRRHMTVGQQAAIVSSAQDWGKAQKVGKPKSGSVTGLDTVAKRSAQSGASDKTQRDADTVAKARPDLSLKVAHGEVSLPKALAQVKDKPAKKPKRELPAAPAADADYEVDNLRATVQALSERNDDLEARVAVEAMDASEDEKTAAATLILELKARVKSLEAEIDALRSTRNAMLTESAELKKSVAYWRRQAEKAAA